MPSRGERVVTGIGDTRTYENVLPDGSDGRVPAASLLGNSAREEARAVVMYLSVSHKLALANC